MRIVGWCRENGLAYQSLVNEISAEEMRTPRNKSKLMPGPRDAPGQGAAEPSRMATDPAIGAPTASVSADPPEVGNRG